MTKVQDVIDEIATLRAFIAAEAGEVHDAIQALTDQVAALRAQLDAGGAATPADLDSILAQLKDAATAVQGIITPPATPTEAAAPSAP